MNGFGEGWNTRFAVCRGEIAGHMLITRESMTLAVHRVEWVSQGILKVPLLGSRLEGWVPCRRL